MRKDAWPGAATQSVCQVGGRGEICRIAYLCCTVSNRLNTLSERELLQELEQMLGEGLLETRVADGCGAGGRWNHGHPYQRPPDTECEHTERSSAPSWIHI